MSELKRCSCSNLGLSLLICGTGMIMPMSWVVGKHEFKWDGVRLAPSDGHLEKETQAPGDLPLETCSETVFRPMGQRLRPKGRKRSEKE